MPVRAGTRLSEKDRAEFDNWGAEQIEQTDDHEKLKIAAEYYREQGFPVTADAVKKRLAQLMKSQPFGRSAVHSDTVEVRASIESFQDELKQRSRLASQPTRVPDMQQELHPPVRGAFDRKRASSAQDSKSTAVMRQSLDLSDEKDQQLLGSAGLKIPSQGTAPKSAAPTAAIPDALVAAAAALGLAPDTLAAAAAASGLTPELQQQAQQKAQPLVQELKPRGAKRTQQLVEQNKQLPKQDRLVMSEQKRCSGNDYFRAGAYADAVEEYTLAVALNPADTACYTNRAASYLKLKEWQAAVADCDMALMLLGGSTGLDQQLRVKALLRRAEAHVGLASHSKALQDYDAVLSLVPDEPRAQQGAAAARAALGIKPGMRRMAVVETDDSSSDQDDDEEQQRMLQQQAPAAFDQQSQQQQQQQGTAAITRSSQHEQQLHGSSCDQVEKASTSLAMALDASADASADKLSAAPSNKDSSHAVTTAGATAADSTATAAEPNPADGSSSSNEGLYQFTALPATSPVVSSTGAAPPEQGVGNADAHFMAELQEAINYMASLSQQAAADTSSKQLGEGRDTPDASSECSGSSSSSSSSSSSCSLSEAEDEALAEFELDQQRSPPQDLAELVMDLPPPFDEQLTQLKDAGNAQFTAKAYADAVALYSKALQHAPDAAVVYVNRAMASLELNRFERAHEDSSIAIALQPDNFKAYHKRYKAKQGLKDYLGAQTDLEACLQYAPKSNKKLQADLQAELKQLQQAADEAMAEELAKASAAQEASVHAYGSCVIEEVADSPEEIQQRLFEELQGKEQSYARQAAKRAQAAVQLRAQYEQQRQLMLDKQQHRLQALPEHQQQQQQRRQMLAEHAAQLSAERAKRKAKHDARRKAKAAAEAAAATQPVAGSSYSSAAIDISNTSGSNTAGLSTAAAATAAEPPTPPASPFDSKLIHNMAAARAARAAAAATTAQGASAATADAPSLPCKTPAATPLSNATPTATPAGSFVAASTLLQQQRRIPTPEQIEDQVAAEVEALKDKGNALLQQGRLEDAEAAYQEALQLDGDNVKVLLNLALLRLRQEDGAGAVRCCEEVLAQPVLPELARLKALVRHGLGLELLGEYAEALAELSRVAEHNSAAGRSLDEQLARDIARVAAKVQQQHHAQQQDAPKLSTNSTATALTPAAVGATARSTRRAQQQQQQQSFDQRRQPAPAAITGMRASIPVVCESEESESEQEAEPAGESTSICSSSSEDKPAGVAPSGVVYSTVAADTNSATEPAMTSQQQQQQQESAEAPAVSPGSARLAKVAVVFESDSESSDDDAESASQQQAEVGAVINSPTKAEESSPTQAAAAATATQQLPFEAENAPAAANDVQQEAAAANQEQQQQQQQQQPDAWSPPQRSRSAGEANAEEISLAASAGLSTMSKLLEETAYSPAGQAQHAGSSGGNASSSKDQASTTSSSSDSNTEAVLHWDPFAPDVDELQLDNESQAQWERLVSERRQKQKQQEQQQQQQQRTQQQESERLTQLAYEVRVMEKLDAAEAAILPAVMNLEALKEGEKGLAAWNQLVQEACTELANKAASQRAAGEAAVQKGNYRIALKHYDAAVAATPKDPQNYAGRAVVWMKLKLWPQAEEDLTAVLLLAATKEQGFQAKFAPCGVGAAVLRKVRQRRALVWKEMRELKKAIAEVKQLLAEDASDSSLQRLLVECKQLYVKQLQQDVQAAQQQQQQQEVEASAAATEVVPSVPEAAESASSPPPPPPVAAEPEPISQVQRHTIVIEETDGSESEGSEPEENLLAPTQQQSTAKQEPLQQPLLSDASDMHGSSTPARAQQAAPPAAASKPVVAGSAAAERVLQQLAHKQHAAPTRVAEFVNTAKTLLAAQQPASSTGSTSAGQQTLGQYVRLFEPSQYKAVIKTELNQEILRYLVLGYQALVPQESEFVAEALLALSRVERFSLVMPMACINKAVKSGLQRLLQQLEEAGQDVSALKGSYKLALK